MKKIYSILSALMLLSSTPMMADTWLEEKFAAMPDSLLTYIPTVRRWFLVDNCRLSKVSPQETTTVFAEKVKYYSFDNFIRLDILSEDRDNSVKSDNKYGVRYEYTALPTENGDTLICLLETLPIPEPETTVTLYDSNWKELSTVDIEHNFSSACIAKPDTMTEETFNELKLLIDFPICQFTITDEPNTFEIKMNPPALNKDEKQRISAILMQRKLKWTGKNFKIY